MGTLEQQTQNTETLDEGKTVAQPSSLERQAQDDLEAALSKFRPLPKEDLAAVERIFDLFNTELPKEISLSKSKDF